MKAFGLLISILLLNSLFFVNLFSQIVEQNISLPVDDVTGLITYQDVVKAEGNKMELFNRASRWANSFYVNPADAIRKSDDEAANIEIRHRFPISAVDARGNRIDAGTIMYSLVIEARDGRFRYTMNDFVLRQASRFPIERWLDKSNNAYNPQWDSFLEQVNSFALNLISSLNAAMQPAEEKTEDEW